MKPDSETPAVEPETPRQCCNGTCARKGPILLRRSDLSKRVYALLSYRLHEGGQVEATTKHDVTEEWRDAVNAIFDDLELRVASTRGRVVPADTDSILTLIQERRETWL